MPTERPKGRYMLMNVFDPGEIRIAICRGEELEEFYLERSREHTLTGNIYKGRVDSVVPGIQAAFVDIGFEKNGFLYVSDIAGTEGTGDFVLEDGVGFIRVGVYPIKSPN